MPSNDSKSARANMYANNTDVAFGFPQRKTVKCLCCLSQHLKKRKEKKRKGGEGATKIQSCPLATFIASIHRREQCVGDSDCCASRLALRLALFSGPHCRTVWCGGKLSHLRGEEHAGLQKGCSCPVISPLGGTSCTTCCLQCLLVPLRIYPAEAP